MDKKPRILVLASGTNKGGGSGFQTMVEASRKNPPILDADIVTVVSNHPNGGVYQKATALGIPFAYWSGPFTTQAYRDMVQKFQADYVMCSGWLKMVRGLDPARTINIHPGPLPRFGGSGMYGHHVHEAVMAAFRAGEIKCSAVTMHEVDEEYDHGRQLFTMPVPIKDNDTPETLAARVNTVEHVWQSYVLNEVVHGRIYLQNGIASMERTAPAA